MKKYFIQIFLICLSARAVLYADELLLIGDDSTPPKYYLENSVPKGFIVDIVVWCMQEMKKPYELQLYPWARAYQMAKDGEGAIIGLSMNSERLKIFDYSEPLYHDDLMVVVKKGKEFSFQSVDDLKGKVVGVSRGTSYGDVFDKAVENKVFKVYEVARIVQALQMTVTERLDAVLIGPGAAGVKQVVASQNLIRPDEISILPVPFKRDAKYLGVLKSHEMKSFVADFNAALKKGKETGVFERIINSYY
jgi:ABC-type amino acid transport substrate-binding protein